jgi:hypothetical protein
MAEQPSASSRGCGPQQNDARWAPNRKCAGTERGNGCASMDRTLDQIAEEVGADEEPPCLPVLGGLARTATQESDSWYHSFFVRHALTGDTGCSCCAGCNMQGRELYQVLGNDPYCAQCWRKWWTHKGQGCMLQQHARRLRRGASSSNPDGTGAGFAQSDSASASGTGNSSSTSGQTAIGEVAVPSRPRPDSNQRPTRTARARGASWPPTRPRRPPHRVRLPRPVAGGLTHPVAPSEVIV